MHSSFFLSIWFFVSCSFSLIPPLPHSLSQILLTSAALNDPKLFFNLSASDVEQFYVPVRTWVAPGSHWRSFPVVWGSGRTSSSTCLGYDPSRCCWPLPPALQTSLPAPAHTQIHWLLHTTHTFTHKYVISIFTTRKCEAVQALFHWLKNLALEIGDRQPCKKGNACHSVGGLW